MTVTNFAALTTEQKTVWARDMWKAARNASFIEKFTGTGPNAMVQRITELRKDEKGARAVLTLIADLVGDGIAGDNTLEGNEEAMKSYDKVIRIDQLRHANKLQGRMADQKSIVNFRENSRDVLAYWLGDRLDQMAFLTLAGLPYTNKNSQASVAGGSRTGSALPDLEFAADVTAPTTARGLRWNGTSGALVVDSATTSVAIGDTPSYKMIVALKAYAKQHYIRGIKGGNNEELFHLFLSPLAFAKLKLDPDYIANLRNAGVRGNSNDLFAGSASSVIVDGVMIHEFRHVPNTSGAASGAKWGGSNLIDGCRALFCGAQALGYADIGDAEWVEKEFDYGNQPGISTGKIFGLLKPKFFSIYDNATEDFGVVTVDVAQ